MNRTKLIQDSTSAYIIAYNQAMQETHNLNMAAQIAGMISMAYMNAFKAEIEQEQQAQSLLGIMLSMVEQVRQDGDDSEKE